MATIMFISVEIVFPSFTWLQYRKYLLRFSFQIYDLAGKKSPTPYGLASDRRCHSFVAKKNILPYRKENVITSDFIETMSSRWSFGIF